MDQSIDWLMTHLGIVDIFVERFAAVDEVTGVDANLLECLCDIHGDLRLEVDVCYERNVVALTEEASGQGNKCNMFGRANATVLTPSMTRQCQARDNIELCTQAAQPQFLNSTCSQERFFNKARCL